MSDELLLGHFVKKNATGLFFSDCIGVIVGRDVQTYVRWYGPGYENGTDAYAYDLYLINSNISPLDDDEEITMWRLAYPAIEGALQRGR